jgi:CHASE3 domain sensor protein
MSAMRKWIPVGFAGVLLLLVGNAIVAYRNTRLLVQNQRRLAHTHEVQRQIDGLLSDLKDMETGQRGFLLTGDESYLSPYEAAQGRVPRSLEKLRELTRDNGDQQARLQSLATLATERAATLARIIGVRRAEGFEAARMQVLEGQGQQEMNRIRVLGAAFMRDEERRLALNAEESRTSARRLLTVFALATALAITAVVGLHWLYRRDQLEHQLADERFRLAVESAPSAMIMVNASGRIVLVNSLAESLFGYDRSELLFADVEVLVPERLRSGHPEFRGQFFAAPPDGARMAASSPSKLD